MSCYKLHIAFKDSAETFRRITEITGVAPLLQKNAEYSDWTYELRESGTDEYIDFINHFCDIVEASFPELSRLGITREDITVWYSYEYEGQCNMEFYPAELKRLGDNGLTLCISCYETGGKIIF